MADGRMLEGPIRFHVIDPRKISSDQALATDELKTFRVAKPFKSKKDSPEPPKAVLIKPSRLEGQLSIE
jgi:hypothetical protein